MTHAQPSWREVAEQLAARVENLAHQCTEHTEPAAHAETCPFCADTMAWVVYRRRVVLADYNRATDGGHPKDR